jgi:hypothetical protein
MPRSGLLIGSQRSLSRYPRAHDRQDRRPVIEFLLNSLGTNGQFGLGLPCEGFSIENYCCHSFFLSLRKRATCLSMLMGFLYRPLSSLGRQSLHGHRIDFSHRQPIVHVAVIALINGKGRNLFYVVDFDQYDVTFACPTFHLFFGQAQLGLILFH